MKKRLSVVLILAVVAGCGTNPIAAEVPGRDQTRAYAGSCEFREDDGKPEGALTGVVDAVLGGVISNTLGRIGKALRAAGEEDADVVIGRHATEFEPGNPTPCILVAKGVWSSSPTDAWMIEPAKGGPKKVVKFGDYHLKDPDFLLEVAVHSSGGKNALRLVPNYFEYRRLIEDDSDLDDRKSRGIAFEVAVHPPDSGPKGKGAVGATLVIGTMTTGYAYNLRNGRRKALAGTNPEWEEGYLPLEYTSAWFPTFAPVAQRATNSKKKAATGGSNAGSPLSPTGSQPSPQRGAAGGGNEVAENETRNQLLPRTVTVTFTETRAPRKFLLFLADVFDASKDDIQKAAELAVLESKQAEAELAAANAANTLMTDYVTKLSAAEVAILEFCSASTAATAAGRSDRIKKSSAANVAQRSANIAALAGSQPQPYTSFVPRGDGQPADSGFCD